MEKKSRENEAVYTISWPVTHQRNSLSSRTQVYRVITLDWDAARALRSVSLTLETEVTYEVRVPNLVVRVILSPSSRVWISPK